MATEDDFVDEQKMEEQLAQQQKVNDFDIREYPIEILILKFITNLKDEDSLGGEIYIPDYQREMKWDEKYQSRFIESLLMNLPVPYIFVADNAKTGDIEIVDGSQRIRTLASFYAGNLVLQGLKVLTEFNGVTIDLLPSVMKKRFLRQTIRLIEMTSQMDEDGRKQMFDRLNSGIKLVPMEIRRGSHEGPLLDFIGELAKNELFRRVCPLSATRLKSRDDLELVLRFFAYTDNYQAFEHSVSDFVTDYLNKYQQSFDKDSMVNDFESMLNFASKLPYGFRKGPNHNSVPRVRFEALAVGISLALKENPDLEVGDLTWLNSEEFIKHTRSDASNSRVKVINRIHYVRDSLLDKKVEYIEGSVIHAKRSHRVLSKNNNSYAQKLLF